MNNNTTKFENPWAGCESTSGEACRLQTWIPLAEYNFLKLIRPRCGTVMAATNTLLKKLIDELRKQGITSIEQQGEFERFVAECVIVVPARPRKKVKV